MQMSARNRWRQRMATFALFLSQTPPPPPPATTCTSASFKSFTTARGESSAPTHSSPLRALHAARWGSHTARLSRLLTLRSLISRGCKLRTMLKRSSGRKPCGAPPPLLVCNLWPKPSLYPNLPFDAFFSVCLRVYIDGIH
jgi:hypothetical protein